MTTIKLNGLNLGAQLEAAKQAVIDATAQIAAATAAGAAQVDLAAAQVSLATAQRVLAATSAAASEDSAEAAQAVYDQLTINDLGTSDGQLTAIDGNPATSFRQQQDERLNATYASVVGLPPSNGVDDTAAIQAVLDGVTGSTTVRGVMGETYLTSAPLVIKSDTTLFRDNESAVSLLPGSNCNMLNNTAITPVRTVTDAAITASSTTLTSATAAFTPADLGRSVTIEHAWGGVTGLAPLTANILSYINATTVELSVPAQMNVTSETLRIFDRNHDIAVGGRWFRNSNTGNQITGATCRLRRIDGLRILPGTYCDNGPGAAGVFCLIGDVTDLDIDNPYVTGGLTGGFQIQGPIRGARVRGVRGAVQDDLVAFVASDWDTHNETAGDLSGIVVDDLEGTSANATIFKVIAGEGVTVRDVTYSRVRGTAGQAVVWIGDDAGNPRTSGGTYGVINGRNVSGAAGGPGLVRAWLHNTERFTLDHARLIGGTAAALVDVRVEAGKTVQAFDVTDVGFAGLAKIGVNIGGGIASIGAAGNIKTLTITRPHLAVTDSASARLLYTNAVSVETINITDPDLRSPVTNGVTEWIWTRGPAGRIAINGGKISGGARVGASSGDSIISLGGGIILSGQGRGWIAKENACALVFLLGTLGIDTMSAEAFYYQSSTAGSITLLGGEGVVYASGAASMIGKSTTATLRVNGRAIKARVSQLTPTATDCCTNTQAETASRYTGPQEYDGARWVPLRGFANAGNTTLAAGTVTVTDANITGSSRLNLIRQTTGGTPGALFVTLNPAVGYTVTSTSATDTSTVRVEIVTY